MNKVQKRWNDFFADKEWSIRDGWHYKGTHKKYKGEYVSITLHTPSPNWPASIKYLSRQSEMTSMQLIKCCQNVIARKFKSKVEVLFILKILQI